MITTTPEDRRGASQSCTSMQSWLHASSLASLQTFFEHKGLHGSHVMMTSNFNDDIRHMGMHVNDDIGKY